MKKPVKMNIHRASNGAVVITVTDSAGAVLERRGLSTPLSTEEYNAFARAFTGLPEFECLRCCHKWVPRSAARPYSCPACRSPYWDKPRRSCR